MLSIKDEKIIIGLRQALDDVNEELSGTAAELRHNVRCIRAQTKELSRALDRISELEALLKNSQNQ
jgi:hypothetical protein